VGSSRRLRVVMTHVEQAPAKLTVELHVTGVREDGMHLIDAEMVTLDLADTLEISDGDGLEVVSEVHGEVPMGESNLVSRALALAGRRAHVRLHKRIPMGGGLGGGSADAGAILRWAGFGDLERAASIGADVPFCIKGGRARVRGIGEEIEPLPAIERAFTLLLPPFGIDTGVVYRRFDELAISTGLLRNDLAPAAFSVEPRLLDWCTRFEAWTGEPVHLAGSGSTLFVEGEFTPPAYVDLAGSRWIVAHTR
jgi:4-diphosphocytidyl-2-C-methyl-D-erythritol kinase